MIRREFLIVASMSTLAAAWPAPGIHAPSRGITKPQGHSLPAPQQWQGTEQRQEKGIPSRQERYRWQIYR